MNGVCICIPASHLVLGEAPAPNANQSSVNNYVKIKKTGKEMKQIANPFLFQYTTLLHNEECKKSFRKL